MRVCVINSLISVEAHGWAGQRSYGPGLERIVSVELALASLLQMGAESQ